jgi:hypothetical protein
VLFANQNGENIGDFTDKRLLAFADHWGWTRPLFKIVTTAGNTASRYLTTWHAGAAWA